MSKRINFKCDTPFQELVLLHIIENFNDDVELEPISDGIRLTDKTGAVADFIYNHDTGRIEMKELDDNDIKKCQERKKAVQIIQRDLLRGR